MKGEAHWPQAGDDDVGAGSCVENRMTTLRYLFNFNNVLHEGSKRQKSSPSASDSVSIFQHAAPTRCFLRHVSAVNE